MYWFSPRHLRRSTPRLRIILSIMIPVLVLTVGMALAHTYTVKPGDTLSEIAERQGLNGWQGLYQANREVVGANPDLIFPGQELEIVEGKIKTQRIRPTYSSGNTVWDRLAQCESGGNWAISTGNGYYGGLQFSLSSWRAAGGSGMPNEASRAEQIRVAQNLQRMQGWGAWPTCSRRIGLR